MYLLGIDVGTSGARAGLFDKAGVLVGSASAPFPLYQPGLGRAEYVSSEIWQAVCSAVRSALAKADVQRKDILGIGFDATCSMIVARKDGQPVSINEQQAAARDGIAWLDHRAVREAEEINDSGAAVLRAVGGRISPEMQVPKLTWLARHLPDTYAEIDAFYDLPDWLVHKATGGNIRSLCSLVCKWTYNGNGAGWDEEFLKGLGLQKLLENRCAPIGSKVLSPGEKAGELKREAAMELGLAEGTPVAVSLIDAHAGALGTLGVDQAGGNSLALIAGTSACHIVQTPRPIAVEGIWGPYGDVILPDQWVLEAGQSACGALLDLIIERHAASSNFARERDGDEERDIHAELADLLTKMAEGASRSRLTAKRHIVPDMLGNRSPLADPSRKGAIVGLDLGKGPEDLALDYLAAIQALAFGTRHILDEMRQRGVTIDTIVVSGGLTRNTIFLTETATITGCDILLPETAEPVLLGSAMLGAVASGLYPSLAEAMNAMGGRSARTVHPDDSTRDYLERKYRVFRRMLNDQKAYSEIMADQEPKQ